MKTITSKTAKNGVQLWYADGKRIAKSEIFTVATENHREIICKALAERNIAAASQTVKHDINLHFIAQITLVDNEFAAGWNEFSFAGKAEAVSAVQAVKNALGDKFHEAVIFYKGGFYAPQDVLTKITADSDETDTDEVNDSDEVKADETQGYIFSKTLVSSGYSAHSNAHYSKLERIDKECKILGNSEQTNGSIYREVAFYNTDHAHSWAVKTSDGKVIISGHDEPDFDKIVEAVKAYETADEVTENEETAEVKVQAGTISICADAVGNGRVAVKVYGRHECAPAKIDSVAAEMPRLSDIHIVAHDNLDFIAKGASYNGRYYPLSNLYIFTNVSNGTDGFKKMYKFDTAKEALRKLARQELEDHIITAEAAAEITKAAAEITKADIEIERQREAKREAERAKREVEWAMYERARHLAAKIALDSKSVNDNFHYCIYCAPQQPVQSALAEDYHEDNNEVFNLLPTVDELNDVEIDDEAKTDEPESDTVFDEMNEIGNGIVDTTKILEDKIANGAPADEVKQIAEYIVERNRDYVEACKIACGAEPNKADIDLDANKVIARATKIRDTNKPEITDETDEDAHNTTEKIEVAIGAEAVPAMIDLFEPNKITLNTPAQILKLIEGTAGNSFSFNYESYFINTDDGTRHKFITRHFVSECKNYSFIEIFTDDGKLDHVEFLKHFLAGYKEVKFYLAAPAQDNVDVDRELVNRMIDNFKQANELTAKLLKATETAGYKSVTCQDGLTILAHFKGAKITSDDDGYDILTAWDRLLGHYDTPAQVESVINRIKACVDANVYEFTFPTTDALKAIDNEAEALNTKWKDAQRQLDKRITVEMQGSGTCAIDKDSDIRLTKIKDGYAFVDYGEIVAAGAKVVLGRYDTPAQVKEVIDKFGKSIFGNRFEFPHVEDVGKSDIEIAEELTAFLLKVTPLTAGFMDLTLQDGRTAVASPRTATIEPDWHGNGRFAFVTPWNEVFARYDTASQVRTVIHRIKHAVEDKRDKFKYPTLAELTAPDYYEKQWAIDFDIYHADSDLTGTELESNTDKLREALTVNGNRACVELEDSLITIYGDNGGDNTTVAKIVTEMCKRDCWVEYPEEEDETNEKARLS